MTRGKEETAESLEIFIAGIPYAQSKTKGRVGGPRKWTDAVVRATSSMKSVQGPCAIEVSFILPPEMFPTDFPFGTDLDNLLKRLLDALCRTVLSTAPGKDSSIVEIVARKRKVAPGEPTEASLIIRRIERRDLP